MKDLLKTLHHDEKPPPEEFPENEAEKSGSPTPSKRRRQETGDTGNNGDQTNSSPSCQSSAGSPEHSPELVSAGLSPSFPGIPRQTYGDFVSGKSLVSEDFAGNPFLLRSAMGLDHSYGGPPAPSFPYLFPGGPAGLPGGYPSLIYPRFPIPGSAFTPQHMGFPVGGGSGFRLIGGHSPLDLACRKTD